MIPTLLLSLALASVPSTASITGVSPLPGVVNVEEERAGLSFGFFHPHQEDPGEEGPADSIGAMELNALRVSAPILTVEYLRRISGPLWVGARAGGFGGTRFTVNGGAQLFWATSLAGGLEARYWSQQGPLSWSTYAAMGYGRSQVLDDDLSRREGLLFWLGADLELFSGLSVGLEFQLHPRQASSSGYFNYDAGPALLLFPLISYAHAF